MSSYVVEAVDIMWESELPGAWVISEGTDSLWANEHCDGAAGWSHKGS